MGILNPVIAIDDKPSSRFVGAIKSLVMVKPATDATALSANIQVAIRIRPLNNQENVDVVSKHADAPVVVVDSRDAKVIRRQFEYDHVFDEDVSSDCIFGCVAPLLQSVLAGYNATVFAYGQTGSGKTYTMGSDGTNDHGIIPVAVRALFEKAAARKLDQPNGYHVEFRVKFVEVYGEEVRDLLSPTLKRLTSASDRVCEEGIASVKECLLLLQKGMLSRKTGKTKMNAASSRSHAIFTVLLKQQLTTSTGTKSTRQSYFNFVDLAGSERQKKTLAEGLRFKEGVDINKGLLALGNVINALSEGKSHIPYRDSKLTKLLQDSLGGNSQTLMLACVSPARRNISETLNSLEYASRARRICNKLVINQTTDAAGPAVMATEVSQLRAQVELLILERANLQARIEQLEREPATPQKPTLATDQNQEPQVPEVDELTTPPAMELGRAVSAAFWHWYMELSARISSRQQWADWLWELAGCVMFILSCTVMCTLQIVSGDLI